MKKINLKSISEVLSEKEMKNVLGGSGATGGFSLLVISYQTSF